MRELLVWSQLCLPPARLLLARALAMRWACTPANATMRFDPAHWHLIHGLASPWGHVACGHTARRRARVGRNCAGGVRRSFAGTDCQVPTPPCSLAFGTGCSPVRQLPCNNSLRWRPPPAPCVNDRRRAHPMVCGTVHACERWTASILAANVPSAEGATTHELRPTRVTQREVSTPL